MKIICDNCNQGDKGSYSSRWVEFEDKKGNVTKKIVTICWECADDRPVKGRTDKQLFEHISTPFWVHMGLKPSKRDKATLKYMKDHNMSWGDLRKARYANMPTTNAGVQQFQQHVDKYGRRNAPDVAFGKKSN